MTSPTQLTLAHLRKDGWTTEVVERWNPHARIRQDLFGIIDVLALKDGDTLAVQATSGSNVASRVRKIAESDTISAIREAGWSIEVWGWQKRDGRWQVRIVDCS